MPYIDPARRQILDLEEDRIQTAGELNYLITNLCTAFLYTHGKSYETMNSILGVLDAASKEFYRRVVAPYEDEKIKKNGDVYDI